MVRDLMCQKKKGKNNCEIPNYVEYGEGIKAIKLHEMKRKLKIDK